MLLIQKEGGPALPEAAEVQQNIRNMSMTPSSVRISALALRRISSRTDQEMVLWSPRCERGEMGTYLTAVRLNVEQNRLVAVS